MSDSSWLAARALPVLGELFPDEVVEQRVADLAALDGGRRRRDRAARISYGFWRDVLEVHDGGAGEAEAFKRLALCEEGLRAAKRCGGLAKYEERLGNADGHYSPTIAELGVIGRLGAVATDCALDVPGRYPPKNYDLRATLQTIGALHVEVKYRSGKRLGVSPFGAALSVVELAFRERTQSDFIIGFAKNRVTEDEIYEVASLVERIGEILDDPASVPDDEWFPLGMRQILHRDFPRTLARRLGTENGEFHLVHVLHRYHVCFDIATRKAWTDHPVLESFVRAPGNGRIWALGLPETQPLYSRESRSSFGHRQRFDDDTPEWQRYRDRLRGAEDQLPDAATSLVAFGLLHDRQVLELKVAVAGEPIRQPDGTVRSCGGIFEEPGWDHVAGVLAFWLDLAGTGAAIGSRWLPNPRARADRSASDETIAAVRDALAGGPRST